MAKDTNLVVARVRIHGGLTIEPEEEGPVEGEPGGRLLVKLPFRYDEVSRERDDYRIRLEATFNGIEADPIEHTGRDRRGLPDDARGFIMREFSLPGPGAYVLSFHATAEYREGEERVRAEHTGELEVAVKESGDWS